MTNSLPGGVGPPSRPLTVDTVEFGSGGDVGTGSVCCGEGGSGSAGGPGCGGGGFVGGCVGPV